MEMQHKWVESENGRVHYWVGRGGKGAGAIVFTHGLTADHTMFERQVEDFAGEYTVIAWDVPLHGLSRPYKNFSYRNAAEELRGILDAEGIGRAVLVGMSMGGYPSQEFSAAYPERVCGFVALDTTPFGLSYYSRSDLRWLEWVEPMAGWFPDGVLRKSMAKSVSRTTYSYEKMMDMLSPLSKAEIVGQMGAAYGVFARENRDISLSMPVLILVGEYDRTGKVRQYCSRWAERTGYPLHLIRNAAHFANGDNPEQVNAEIREFIKEIRSAGDELVL